MSIEKPSFSPSTTSSSSFSSTAASALPTVPSNEDPFPPPVDFSELPGQVGIDSSLTWHIVNDSDTRTFQTLNLIRTTESSTDPAQFPVDESIDDLTKAGLKIFGVPYAVVQNLTDDVANSPQCTSSRDPCTLQTGGTLFINIRNTSSISVGPKSDKFFFGLKYRNDDTGTDDFFYSHLFSISTDPVTPAISGGSSGSSTPGSTSSTITATPTPTAVTTSISATPSGSSRGLSTGAKVGIAIGSVGFVLLVIAALLFWRRNKKRQAYAYPGGPAYNSQDFPSGERDIHAEKEMNVMSTTSSPYEAVESHSGLANIPAVVHESGHGDQRQGQRESWIGSDQERDVGGITESYHDNPSAPPAVPTPPPNNSSAYSPTQAQAQPVTGGVSHLHEPGMGPEELARLEEEERRLDEAIAEAERRRT